MTRRLKSNAPDAEGSHKIKPMVVGKPMKPKFFCNFMDNLPVSWNASKLCIPLEIFKEWFDNVFVPAVCCFQMQVKGIPRNKVKVVLLDSATAHCNLPVEELWSSNGRIRVEFLPPNITFSQPMDQGIIMAFKNHYRHILLNQILPVEPTWGEGGWQWQQDPQEH